MNESTGPAVKTSEPTNTVDPYPVNAPQDKAPVSNTDKAAGLNVQPVVLEDQRA